MTAAANRAHRCALRPRRCGGRLSGPTPNRVRSVGLGPEDSEAGPGPRRGRPQSQLQFSTDSEILRLAAVPATGRLHCCVTAAVTVTEYLDRASGDASGPAESESWAYALPLPLAAAAGLAPADSDRPRTPAAVAPDRISWCPRHSPVRVISFQVEASSGRLCGAGARSQPGFAYCSAEHVAARLTSHAALSRADSDAALARASRSAHVSQAAWPGRGARPRWIRNRRAPRAPRGGPAAPRPCRAAAAASGTAGAGSARRPAPPAPPPPPPAARARARAEARQPERRCRARRATAAGLRERVVRPRERPRRASGTGIATRSWGPTHVPPDAGPSPAGAGEERSRRASGTGRTTVRHLAHG